MQPSSSGRRDGFPGRSPSGSPRRRVEEERARLALLQALNALPPGPAPSAVVDEHPGRFEGVNIGGAGAGAGAGSSVAPGVAPAGAGGVRGGVGVGGDMRNLQDIRRLRDMVLGAHLFMPPNSRSNPSLFPLQQHQQHHHHHHHPLHAPAGDGTGTGNDSGPNPLGAPPALPVASGAPRADERSYPHGHPYSGRAPVLEPGDEMHPFRSHFRRNRCPRISWPFAAFFLYGVVIFLGSSNQLLTFLLLLALIGTMALIVVTCTAIQSRMATQARRARMARGHGIHRLRRHGGLSMAHMQLMMMDRDFDANDYDTLLALDESTPTQALKAATASEISRFPTFKFKPKSGSGASAPSDDPATSEPGGDASSKQASGSGSASPSSAPFCAICLEKYEEGEEVKIIPCFHQFHSGCIDKWLSMNAICPVCKTSVRG